MIPPPSLACELANEMFDRAALKSTDPPPWLETFPVLGVLGEDQLMPPVGAKDSAESPVHFVEGR